MAVTTQMRPTGLLAAAHFRIPGVHRRPGHSAGDAEALRARRLHREWLERRARDYELGKVSHDDALWPLLDLADLDEAEQVARSTRLAHLELAAYAAWRADDAMAGVRMDYRLTELSRGSRAD
jgi:hypothetical protein